MKRFFSYTVLILAVLTLVSCSKSKIDSASEVTVEFIFDLAAGMPEFDKTDSGTKVIPTDDAHDIRYQVRAYRQLPTGGYAKDPLYKAVFSKDEVSDVNFVGSMSVTAGTYRLLAWVDYVNDGSIDDLHYDTEDFRCIGLVGDEYVANTELSDVLVGETVINAQNSGGPIQAYLELYRPVGKYEIVSDDLAEFLEQQAGDNDETVSLDDFHAVVTYRSYMPNNFNLINGKPDDSAAGISYKAPITRINDNEALMGFDYVLIPEETVLSISVKFYSNDGKLMADTGSFDIPLKRGHVTKVVRKYLTGSVGGGVDIDTDFDGDNNIPLN